MVDPIRLSLPLSEAETRKLRAGDMVYLNGNIVTGRDKVHKRLYESKPPKESLPFPLEGSVLYHCGPLMKKTDGDYQVVSAGPTTSIRVEMYEADIIRRYGLRGIMGKGGMGEKTHAAMKDSGCVYFHAVGGAAVFLAERIKEIIGTWKLEEFGPTEAMWCFRIEEYPAVVTMDADGNSIHRDIERESKEMFSQIAGLPGR